MSSPLFLDKTIKPTFQKIAMPVRLSESPEAWQRDIAGEIYKQLPYIGEYAVNVILDRVEAQRGYGFGSAHISNRTEAPMQQQEEMPSVRIPIVIRDYLMSPLDVFMDNAGVYPLTESRLREKLFRPETMEMSTRKPSDRNLSDQLYPPMRSNYGMNSMTGGDMGKMANDAEAARRAYISRMRSEAAANNTHIAGEKCATLLETIAPTIGERAVTDFIDKIANDRELALLAVQNETFQKLAMTIATASSAPVEKTASALVDSIKPTIVQFEKLASGDVRVKWANAQAFAPQEDVVSPQTAAGMGADTASMKPGDTVTVSSEKAQKQSLDEPVYVKVEQFGKYCVKDADSNGEHCGWVIPVVDLENHPLEFFVFLSGNAGPMFAQGETAPPTAPGNTPTQVWAAQDEIAGKPQGGNNEEFAAEVLGQPSQPQGSGMFVSPQGQCCLLPMTIQNGMQGGLMGETMFGEPVTLQMVPGLQRVEMMGEGVYGIPAELQWVPLPGDPVFLAKSPLDVQNTQEAQQAPNQMQVGATGQGEFSLQGQPLAKVAKDQRTFVKRAQAEFLLVAAGLSPADAKATLDKAERSDNWVKCAGRAITPLAHLHRDMVKQAQSYIEGLNLDDLRQDLIKEATIIEDSDTADKVLSMNFINPENIGMFAKFLPELDGAAKKLAELLLGVRLGIGSVDEGAVERAMKGLEVVIEGLKMLQQKATA